jgi:hypothetical protein
VFLSGCNLRCLFCQNYDISREAAGVPVSPEGLAAMILDLEARGCHNVNFVSPTHVMPQILEGLAEAHRPERDAPAGRRPRRRRARDREARSPGAAPGSSRRAGLRRGIFPVSD